jgi:polyisoprenoid-binding protein YceI
MLHRIKLLAVFVALIFSSVCLNARIGFPEPFQYVIDPEHFSVGFLVDHIGYAKILGIFRKAEGSFVFDEETLELEDVVVTIEAASIFTNHKKRDAHLRGGDFLNSREFPTIIFTGQSNKILEDQKGIVSGSLTLLGKSLPVTLDVTWNKSDVYPFGHKKHTIGLSVRGAFKRSDYDMSYAVANGWVGDKIELIIELEANRE